MTYANISPAPGRSGGWQVQEERGDLTQVERSQLLERASFSFHDAPTDRLPNAACRRLLAVQTVAGLGLWHQAPAGLDATNRGNVFTHAVLFRDRVCPLETARPIDLWDSADWLTPFGKDAVESARLGAPPRCPSETHPRAESFTYLKTADSWASRRLWPALIERVTIAVEGRGRPLVLAVVDADEGAKWIAAVTHALPRFWAGRVGFSTYETAESIGRTLAGGGVHIAALRRRDLVSAQRAGFLERALVVDVANAATIPAVVGSSPWSGFALSLLGRQATAVEQLYERADEAEAAWHDVDSTPPQPWWPLAAALARDPNPVRDPTLTKAEGILDESPLQVMRALDKVMPVGGVAVGTPQWAANQLQTLTQQCNGENDCQALVKGIEVVDQVLTSDSTKSESVWRSAWDGLATAGQLVARLGDEHDAPQIVSQLGQIGDEAREFVRAWVTTRMGVRPLAASAVRWLLPEPPPEIDLSRLNDRPDPLGDALEKQRIDWQWHDWHSGVVLELPFRRTAATLLAQSAGPEYTTKLFRAAEFTPDDLANLVLQYGQDVPSDFICEALISRPRSEIAYLMDAIRSGPAWQSERLRNLVNLRKFQPTTDNDRENTVVQLTSWLRTYDLSIEQWDHPAPNDELVGSAQFSVIWLALQDRQKTAGGLLIPHSALQRHLKGEAASALIDRLDRTRSLSMKQRAAGALAVEVVASESQGNKAPENLHLTPASPLAQAVQCEVECDGKQQAILTLVHEMASQRDNTRSVDALLEQYARTAGKPEELLINDMETRNWAARAMGWPTANEPTVDPVDATKKVVSNRRHISWMSSLRTKWTNLCKWFKWPWHLRQWLVLMAPVVVAAIILLLVVLMIVNAIGPTQSDRVAGDPTLPSKPIVAWESLPGAVRFTWTYGHEAEGDRYRVTLQSGESLESPEAWYEVETTDTICLRVRVLRGDDSGPRSDEACATPGDDIPETPEPTVEPTESDSLPAPPSPGEIEVKLSGDAQNGFTWTWDYPEPRDDDTYRVILSGDVAYDNLTKPEHRLTATDFVNWDVKINGAVCLAVIVHRSDGRSSSDEHSGGDKWSESVCTKP
ncbi:MAG: hypothetical protein LBN10_08740 [Propionibacteriaceae bacterium]|jgi:hypothetical protein|nr:hypothetical protein [Propionibacteriaceae bacterium]